MLETLRQFASDSHYVTAEAVPAITLDEFGVSEPAFVKLDVQGYESRVLDGANRVMPYIEGIHIEMSLVPLYDGEKPFDVMEKRLRDLGFKVWAILPGAFDSENGRMLQVDAVMFR